ncbi:MULTISPECIES: hypothetical protein [unclassified Mesorhizobium]|uniref:hypothetical protein n=1 Tax=unclassified Mesorhizobium TaxID=325217 RepID=UPI0018DC2F3F|nr:MULTISPECIES: hypothetical protein [unclassified Mesorhizobium]WJI60155.1 hypothetical protein NLY33_24870 [Mesorhizobium sp. C432A]
MAVAVIEGESIDAPAPWASTMVTGAVSKPSKRKLVGIRLRDPDIVVGGFGTVNFLTPLLRMQGNMGENGCKKPYEHDEEWPAEANALLVRHTVLGALGKWPSSAVVICGPIDFAVFEKIPAIAPVEEQLAASCTAKTMKHAVNPILEI